MSSLQWKTAWSTLFKKKYRYAAVGVAMHDLILHISKAINDYGVSILNIYQGLLSENHTAKK